MEVSRSLRKHQLYFLVLKMALIHSEDSMLDYYSQL